MNLEPCFENWIDGADTTDDDEAATVKDRQAKAPTMEPMSRRISSETGDGTEKGKDAIVSSQRKVGVASVTATRAKSQRPGMCAQRAV